MQEKLRGCISGKKSDTIIITGKMTEYNKILLRHGRLADYLPFYVEGKEFFDVIRKTLQIFDDMKNYTYDYYQISGDSCEFWVSISS